jgi:hypothetical protein
VLVVGSAAVLVGLFFLLREPDADAPAGAQTTTATTAATTTTPATTATTATAAVEPPPPPAPRRLRVLVRNGRVAGGIRTFGVSRGERFVVVVRADVADHVHVHGYDRFADVGPGRPAQIALRATIRGRFDIELEDRHLLIARLEVR